jgi:glyoxalase family protein
MIHHITAICADAQVTTDFYTKALGLRLVKLTVNQDDVGTYHLYFGNRIGDPGTVLTFFPWKHLPKGKSGPGMVSAVAFAVPKHSLQYWEERLRKNGVAVHTSSRFQTHVLSFVDPDGLALELVETTGSSTWTKTIAKEHAIISFYGATLCLHEQQETAELLTTHFEYKQVAQEGNWVRLSHAHSALDLHEAPEAHQGIPGHGTVHHIAFRSANAVEQATLRKQLLQEGLHLTPQIDRYYFMSVYFREPGGILFEIATDDPGFTVDEPEESLGSKLVLPPLFELHRKEIEELLPPFRFH